MILMVYCIWSLIFLICLKYKDYLQQIKPRGIHAYFLGPKQELCYYYSLNYIEYFNSICPRQNYFLRLVSKFRIYSLDSFRIFIKQLCCFAYKVTEKHLILILFQKYFDLCLKNNTYYQ